MSEYRQALLSLLVRSLVGVPLVLLGIFLLQARSPLGFAAILTGAAILSFPLARILAEPFGGLLYPRKSAGRPPPMYSIPESRRAKGFPEEAIAGYREIAARYPREVKPYIEMVDIAVVDLRDLRRADFFYHEGLAKITDKDALATLSRMYEAICTRVDSAPSKLRADGGE